MSTELLLTLVAAAAAVWAAFFATRADWSVRRSMRNFEQAAKPAPNIVFGQASPGRAVELEIENLGGTMAAGGIIVHVSDELYAGELTMANNAGARRISLPFVVKAWKRQLEPQCLVLVGRDATGRCWDYVDGGKQIKNPRRWLTGQLRELRMQGMVDFPKVTGKERR